MSFFNGGEVRRLQEAAREAAKKHGEQLRECDAKWHKIVLRKEDLLADSRAQLNRVSQQLNEIQFGGLKGPDEHLKQVIDSLRKILDEAGVPTTYVEQRGIPPAPVKMVTHALSFLDRVHRLGDPDYTPPGRF